MNLSYSWANSQDINLLRLPLKFQKRPISADENFNQHELAITKEGIMRTIENYQAAVNMAIEEIDKISDKDGLPEIKITGFRNSFSRIDLKIPRVGLYNINISLEDAHMRSLYKEGPSDIDLVAPLFSDCDGEHYCSLKDAIDIIEAKIFYQYGIIVHFYLFESKYELSLPIIKISGDALLGKLSSKIQLIMNKNL